MAKPYYLIDFENVQPKALDRLKPGEARIKVFLGEQQTSLKREMVQALQPFGPDVEYVDITGNGPNAVDFHIAYYMGRTSAQEPSATFHIISKDKGFDPLVRHLNARGIACQRLAEIPAGARVAAATAAAVPAASTPAATMVKKAARKSAAKRIVVTVDPAPPPLPKQLAATDQQVQVVLACLAKSTRPGKVAGLRASIKSWLQPSGDEKAIDAVVRSLQARDRVRIDGTKVTYAEA